tara:strand:- start:87 stop:500 length:414 start_codon:yes stop_codon:yes gene_type:complete
MYSAASLEPLNEKHATAKCDHPGCKDGKHPSGADCKKCDGDGWIDANDLKTGPKKVEEGEDTGRIPHDVDSFKGPDDQDNTSYQVPAELDAAVSGPGRDGDFIEYLNTIEWTDQGAADLVEWINQYNTGASYDREAY